MLVLVGVTVLVAPPVLLLLGVLALAGVEAGVVAPTLELPFCGLRPVCPLLLTFPVFVLLPAGVA